MLLHLPLCSTALKATPGTWNLRNPTHPKQSTAANTPNLDFQAIRGLGLAILTPPKAEHRTGTATAVRDRGWVSVGRPGPLRSVPGAQLHRHPLRWDQVGGARRPRPRRRSKPLISSSHESVRRWEDGAGHVAPGLTSNRQEALLVAKGIATRNPGIVTRSKDATRITRVTSTVGTTMDIDDERPG